jgi:hypothetical protein
MDEERQRTQSRCGQRTRAHGSRQQLSNESTARARNILLLLLRLCDFARKVLHDGAVGCLRGLHALFSYSVASNKIVLIRAVCMHNMYTLRVCCLLQSQNEASHAKYRSACLRFVRRALRAVHHDDRQTQRMALLPSTLLDGAFRPA